MNDERTVNQELSFVDYNYLKTILMDLRELWESKERLSSKQEALYWIESHFGLRLPPGITYELRCIDGGNPLKGDFILNIKNGDIKYLYDFRFGDLYELKD